MTILDTIASANRRSVSIAGCPGNGKKRSYTRTDYTASYSYLSQRLCRKRPRFLHSCDEDEEQHATGHKQQQQLVNDHEAVDSGLTKNGALATVSTSLATDNNTVMLDVYSDVDLPCRSGADPGALCESEEGDGTVALRQTPPTVSGPYSEERQTSLSLLLRRCVRFRTGIDGRIVGVGSKCTDSDLAQDIRPTSSFPHSQAREDIHQLKPSLWWNKADRVAMVKRTRGIASTYKIHGGSSKSPTTSGNSTADAATEATRRRVRRRIEDEIESCRRIGLRSLRTSGDACLDGIEAEDECDQVLQGAGPLVVPGLARGIESMLCADISQMRRLHVETVLQAQAAAAEACPSDPSARQDKIARAAILSGKPGVRFALQLGMGDEWVAQSLRLEDYNPSKPSVPQVSRSNSLSSIFDHYWTASNVCSVSEMYAHQSKPTLSQSFPPGPSAPAVTAPPSSRVVSPLSRRFASQDKVSEDVPTPAKALCYGSRKRRRSTGSDVRRIRRTQPSSLLLHPRGRRKLSSLQKRELWTK